MHDDEVPLHAPAGAREIAAGVAVLVSVAVGDAALVLHAEVRRLDELVAVLVPRIRPEPVLEALQHRNRLAELHLRRVGVVGERPVVDRQLALLAVERVGEMRVLAGVDLDVVVVDRIGDEPLERRRAVGVVRRAAQTAVRDVRHRIGNRDRDALAVRLVGQQILVRPPDARAESLDRRRDPPVAEAVALPDQAAVPRRTLRGRRLSVVVDGDRLLRRRWAAARSARRRTRCRRDETSACVRPGPCCRRRAAPAGRSAFLSTADSTR